MDVSICVTTASVAPQRHAALETLCTKKTLKWTVGLEFSGFFFFSCWFLFFFQERNTAVFVHRTPLWCSDLNSQWAVLSRLVWHGVVVFCEGEWKQVLSVKPQMMKLFSRRLNVVWFHQRPNVLNELLHLFNKTFEKYIRGCCVVFLL